MRLNKYIASAGICSRRKADELIAAGNVKINGAVIREMGCDVKDGDQVTVNGKPIEAAGLQHHRSSSDDQRRRSCLSPDPPQT